MRKVSVLIATLFLLTSCGTVPLTGRKQLLLLSDTELVSASLTQYNDFCISVIVHNQKKYYLCPQNDNEYF